MKNFTRTKPVLNLRLLLYAAILLIFVPVSGQQTVMYGDTIFWENFGTGTTRSDISGRGNIGSSYQYEGPTKFVYSLNVPALNAAVTGFMALNPGNDYIIDIPRFYEIPLTSSAAPQADKPAAGVTTALDHYWKISSWASMNIPATEYAIATDAYTYDDNINSNMPCSWIRIEVTPGVYEWKFGYYLISYEDAAYTEVVPNDGFYALINNTNNFTNPTADSYLQNAFLDHSGWSDLATSPFTPAAPGGATHSGNGRMLFANCSQNSALSGAVYKRQVTELCRDAEFEFSVWLASVHDANNNSQFRIEIWSDDPGNDPNLGTITPAYIGQTVDIAGGARLIHMGSKYLPAALGVWYQLKENFVLTGQDYCYVVVRNFGTGSGNDIVIDDLVFKPYSPFNLDVQLSTTSVQSACVDGLVTLLSYFPSPMPAAVGDISQYGFYFQGDLNGTWVRLGNEIPIQTQAGNIPLELTLPLAEYNKYSRYRVTVATTPSGFGGRCITFTYPPIAKEPIPSSPNFTLAGDDVCADGDGDDTDQTGTFRIRNINQEYCEGWQVKVRRTNGSTVTVETYQPTTKGSCELSKPVNRIQTVANGVAIAPIVFTWSGAATGAIVTNLPAGLIATPSGNTVTISGTPTASGTYTITTVGGTPEQIQQGTGSINVTGI